MIGIIIAVQIIIILLLRFWGRRCYPQLSSFLSRKDFLFHSYIPAGLFLLDKLNIKFRSAHARKLHFYCEELYGMGKASFMLKIYFAQKVIYISGILLFLEIYSLYEGGVDLGAISCILAIGLGAFFLPDFTLFEKCKKRKLLLRLEFPLFMNKFLLLIHAGMTVKGAWVRIAAESSPESILGNEWMHASKMMESGEDEIVAYGYFAKRCKLTEASKFVSLLTMNVKKGGGDILRNLRLLSSECWEIRKNTALKLGEEASSKMVLPLTLNLIAIIVVMISPVMFSMSLK